MVHDEIRSKTARNLLAVRAARKKMFPNELFDEFAWNMLLHLFIALQANENVSEANLIGRAATTEATGRRWLRHLVSDGLVRSWSEGQDIAMMPDALANMRVFLDSAAVIHGSTGPA